jgi:hypothetical protein
MSMFNPVNGSESISPPKAPSRVGAPPAEAPADPAYPRDSFSGGGPRKAVKVADSPDVSLVRGELGMRGVFCTFGGYAAVVASLYVNSGVGATVGQRLLGGILHFGGGSVGVCGLLLLLASLVAPPKTMRLVANKLGLDKG